tara:strand:+ start:494 stop:682 length:189 start_codon:yes stop_codon:yes gene_type:complete
LALHFLINPNDIKNNRYAEKFTIINDIESLIAKGLRSTTLNNGMAIRKRKSAKTIVAKINKI